jgi:hypothetical protein
MIITPKVPEDNESCCLLVSFVFTGVRRVQRLPILTTPTESDIGVGIYTIWLSLDAMSSLLAKMHMSETGVDSPVV